MQKWTPLHMQMCVCVCLEMLIHIRIVNINFLSTNVYGGVWGTRISKGPLKWMSKKKIYICMWFEVYANQLKYSHKEATTSNNFMKQVEESIWREEGRCPNQTSNILNIIISILTIYIHMYICTYVCRIYKYQTFILWKSCGHC